jgi:type IV secretory pathway VirB2 component (pilin)
MRKQKTMVASDRFGDVLRFSKVALLSCGVYLLFCGSAQATMIAEVLCSAVSLVLIDIGRGLTTLAVVALGVAALLGKATWGQGLTIITGIGLIYGAGLLALTLTTGPLALASTVAAAAISPGSALTATISLAGCLR